MRKFILLALMLVVVKVYGQDTIPVQAKSDENSGIELKDGVDISKSGTMYSRSGKTYTEIYEVVTDSMVYRFGLEFRSADSSFVRKVPMQGYTREFYDMMKVTTKQVLENQENARKETIEFLNRYRTSPEVWLLFKIYGILE